MAGLSSSAAEHGRQPGRVADGTERGDGRLAAQRVGVAAVGRDEPASASTAAVSRALAQGPRRHLHHRRVRVVEQARPRRPAGRVAASSAARRRTAGSASASAGRQVVVGQQPEPVQRSERGGPHRTPPDRRGRPGPSRVARMARHGHGATAVRDVAVAGFRGRLHVTTMTDDEQPDPAAAPEDGTGRTDLARRRPPTVRRRRASGATAPGASGAVPDPAPTACRPPVGHRSDATARRRAAGSVRRSGSSSGSLLVAVVVASRIYLDYYAIQPGTAQSVQPFITVPADRAHPVAHPVLLTDVRRGPGHRPRLPVLQAAVGHRPLLGARR